MTPKTLIIGGGLTGLSLAYRLQQAGEDYQLIEARARLGGRIKSVHLGDSAFDLGPSWVWPGQERAAQLLSELNLATFPQWEDGAQLFEHPTGEVIQNRGFMSMAGSLRIKGGTSALTDALAAKLDQDKVHVGMPVTGLSSDPIGAWVQDQFIAADRIVVAVPPRIAANLSYTPALPKAALSAMQAIPTWMAAHAKCVAVYDTPFWRADGLSGDASSRRGPMVELHDASPFDTSLGAIFGFIGVPAQTRATAGEALAKAALAQLVNLFGPQAATPLSLTIEDWSQAPFTATPADMTPPPSHPPYTMPSALNDLWDTRLIFAVTELSRDNGGLIEGALAASENAHRLITKSP